MSSPSPTTARAGCVPSAANAGTAPSERSSTTCAPDGWVDAFRALHGYGERQASWTFARDRGGWRLDHVLVHGLRPLASAYAHDWRRAGLSDHSALVADLVR